MKLVNAYVVGRNRFGFIIEIEKYISIYSRKIYKTKQEARNDAERIAKQMNLKLDWEAKHEGRYI